MRIIYFSPHPTHDIVSDVGYSTHQREMIFALRALGHEVYPVIIGGSTKEELPKVTTNQRPSALVSLIKALVPKKIWRTMKDAKLMQHDKTVAGPRLREAIKKYQPELIYERSEYCLKQGCEIAAEYGIKHIYEVNAPCVEEWLEFEGGSFLTSKANDIEQIKMTTTSGMCSVSNPLKEFVVKRYGVNADQVCVIPNAINLERIKSIETPEDVREKHGYKVDDVVIGFIGAMLPYHGVDLLVKSFISAFTENQNLRLHIVGDGELLSELKRMITTAGLDSYARFAGRVPHSEVWSHMALMDICSNPKHSWYGSPIKTFEYGAMSKAIIAPNEGNMRDVLMHQKSAWLFDGTESGLKEAMLHLAANKEIRVRIGSQFHTDVLSKHTWESNAKGLVEFADQL